MEHFIFLQETVTDFLICLLYYRWGDRKWFELGGGTSFLGFLDNIETHDGININGGFGVYGSGITSVVGR